MAAITDAVEHTLDASDDDRREHITFGVYAARWLENRQVSGRPINYVAATSTSRKK